VHKPKDRCQRKQVVYEKTGLRKALIFGYSNEGVHSWKAGYFKKGGLKTVHYFPQIDQLYSLCGRQIQRNEYTGK